jgi:hypothetical protein
LEFVECNSFYSISEKSNLSEISSDGEFEAAAKIDLFAEDDSFINLIEDKKIKSNIFKYNFID